VQIAKPNRHSKKLLELKELPILYGISWFHLIGINYPFFDFKYINGLNIFGLNRPAVFSREELHRLFSLYRNKTEVYNFHELLLITEMLA